MPSPNLSIDNLKHENNQTTALSTILESARPFLRGELQAIDANLPRLVSVLQAAGAGECWHKHGSFLDHLVGVYRILKLWKAPDSVCLCGLFHSAYSNSYVNLAIFPHSSVGRDTVRGHVGDEAEQLIHLFCIVPRQALIHDELLFKYTDEELVEHLRLSEISVNHAVNSVDSNDDENCSWREKIQAILPADGVLVKHIKTGEDLLVPRRIVVVFLFMTMADFSDQLFGFQDQLFKNTDGRLAFSGNNTMTALWPGDGKPGLWMNSISRMGAIYTLIVREEKIYEIEIKGKGAGDRYGELDLVIPPVFEGCTKIVDAMDQIVARDLYWKAVCEMEKIGLDEAEKMLLASVAKNPFVGEPYVLLGQIYLGEGRFEEAEEVAEKGVRLLLEWGSPWDKRMSWQGWIAWGRVMVLKAKDKSWPTNPWGILNLGLVK